MTFKTAPIGDVASVQTGPFGSQLHNKDYVLVGTPIVTVEHLGQRKMSRQNLPCVSDVDKIRLSKYALEYGDLVFSRVGSVDRCSLVSEEEEGWLFSGRCLRARPNNPLEIYHKYLYYFFNLESTKMFVRNIAVGATMPSINTQLLSDVSITFPSIAEQHQIGDTLSAIDDQIEINSKINDNLEQTAQTIFKRWFIDFDFPNQSDKPYKISGGKMQSNEELGIDIPVGWKSGTVNDLCESITSGGTPKRMEHMYWNGDIAWFKTGELTDGPLINSEECITKEGLENSACKLWNENTILIALYASPTVGRLGILKTEATSNQACSGLVAKEEIGHSFLFYTLRFKRDEFNNVAVGAAQQNINQQIVKEAKIIIPPKSVLDKFNELVSLFFDKRTDLTKQNAALVQTRDSLLPKLMSGELSVTGSQR
jgi:type I restriction enzyme S subunit